MEPIPLPETQPFWEGAAEKRLVIQRCADCGNHYFPPSPVCPHCTSRNVKWTEASGRARLYSYTISKAAWPQWQYEGLWPVAMIALEEGPMLLSTVTESPDALAVDMPLHAVWRSFGKNPAMLCFAAAPEVTE